MSDERLTAALEAVARRALVAVRVEPPDVQPLLASIVEATRSIFDAESASLALHDPATDRLVFRYAAGPAGDGVVGLAVGTDQGIAGYVFTTGQALAVADVRSDPRFSQQAAERTGYVPRSILAVPLADDVSTLGVLEVLDLRSGAAFGLRELEMAGVFARQATIAIRTLRRDRDVAELLRRTLAGLARPVDDAEDVERSNGVVGDPDDALDAAVDAAVRRALADLGDDDAPLWSLVDAAVRARDSAPEQVALVVDILEALARRSERRGRGRR